MLDNAPLRGGPVTAIAAAEDFACDPRIAASIAVSTVAASAERLGGRRGASAEAAATGPCEEGGAVLPGSGFNSMP